MSSQFFFVKLHIFPPLGQDSILARVSFVNYFGNCVYDKFIKPLKKVTDYRTDISGIQPKDFDEQGAEDFEKVQKEVLNIVQGKILVGYSVKKNLKLLALPPHPKENIRECDTSTYNPFQKIFRGTCHKYSSFKTCEIPSLKEVIYETLDGDGGDGDLKTDSVQDAKNLMKIYKKFREEWEHELLNNPIHLYGAMLGI